MATAALLALALLAQDAPIATAVPQAQPAAATAPSRPAATAPTDEYGYVGWCYGALGGYLELYDKVMPEVTRIEKAFPGPDGVAASLKVYPEMRAEARDDLQTYRAAITAAEKASPRPISEYGKAAIAKGRSVWAGSDVANKARLAQVWMSWSPPGDCETRAKTLEAKSNLFGQALNYNAPKAAEPTPEPMAPAEAAPPAPAATPVADAGLTLPPPKPKTKAAVTAADAFEFKPCAGRLLAEKRGGKTVLVCKAD
ncbi:MAG: hypothetical protein JWP92_2975 [Caulobacter sp.]|nr:hypothetical protein [Caulobacter sp.]